MPLKQGCRMTYLRVSRDRDTYYLFVDPVGTIFDAVGVLAKLLGRPKEELRLCRAGLPLEGRLSLSEAAVTEDDVLAYQTRVETGLDAEMRPVYDWV